MAVLLSGTNSNTLSSPVSSMIDHTPSATHPDTAALTVLASILSDVPGGRLHKAMVETRLATSAGAGDGTGRSSLRARALGPELPFARVAIAAARLPHT